MGIFKSIFSSNRKKTKRGVEFNLRAEYKDQLFFEESIIQEDKIIEMLMENDEFDAFQLWNISMKHLRKVYLKYSLGEKVSLIKDDFVKAFDFYIKGWDELEATYADMLDMVSLSVLFGITDKEIDQLIDYVNKTEGNSKLKDWKPDYLLGYFLNVLRSSRRVPDTILIPSMYQQLVDLTKLEKEEAQKEMKSYLEKWYPLNKNNPWYNNHKKQNGYKGYWSWEAAAVVKVKGLDDSGFKDHLNYPSDMINWE